MNLHPTDLPHEPVHIPVLAQEILAAFDPQPGQTIVDGTLGGGGHAAMLAERIVPGGRVIGMDRDRAAVESAAGRLGHLPVFAVHGNFCDIPEALAERNIQEVDGVLLDLGLSSDQLADEARGFSFHADGPLDLRFDTTRGDSAARLLERLSEKHLADLIYEYGEERLSRRIARRIVEVRRTKPIRSAQELATLVSQCVPPVRGPQRIHPATRTFQALRIAVNEELKSLELALKRLPDVIRPGGTLAIISFHSLEDRPVKTAFREDPRFETISRKPICASEYEVARNPRSRSAKLRVAKLRVV